LDPPVASGFNPVETSVDQERKTFCCYSLLPSPFSARLPIFTFSYRGDRRSLRVAPCPLPQEEGAFPLFSLLLAPRLLLVYTSSSGISALAGSIPSPFLTRRFPSSLIRLLHLSTPRRRSQLDDIPSAVPSFFFLSLE